MIDFENMAFWRITIRSINSSIVDYSANVATTQDIVDLKNVSETLENVRLQMSKLWQGCNGKAETLKETERLVSKAEARLLNYIIAHDIKANKDDHLNDVYTSVLQLHSEIITETKRNY